MTLKEAQNHLVLKSIYESKLNLELKLGPICEGILKLSQEKDLLEINKIYAYLSSETTTLTNYSYNIREICAKLKPEFKKMEVGSDSFYRTYDVLKNIECTVDSFTVVRECLKFDGLINIKDLNDNFVSYDEIISDEDAILLLMKNVSVEGLSDFEKLKLTTFENITSNLEGVKVLEYLNYCKLKKVEFETELNPEFEGDFIKQINLEKVGRDDFNDLYSFKYTFYSERDPIVDNYKFSINSFYQEDLLSALVHNLAEVGIIFSRDVAKIYEDVALKAEELLNSEDVTKSEDIIIEKVKNQSFKISDYTHNILSLKHDNITADYESDHNMLGPAFNYELIKNHDFLSSMRVFEFEGKEFYFTPNFGAELYFEIKDLKNAMFKFLKQEGILEDLKEQLQSLDAVVTKENDELLFNGIALTDFEKVILKKDISNIIENKNTRSYENET